MITKEEREKDKAICDAAGRFEVEYHGHEEWWIYDSPGSYAARVGEVDTPQMAAFIETAGNRLPLYIADAEEVEKRLTELEATATRWEQIADHERSCGNQANVTHWADKAAALRLAVGTIRGKQ